MIRHVSGQVAYIGETFITIDVAGIGYQVYVGQPTGFTLGKQVKLHTFHAIRENISDLYGFSTLDELEIFELLLSLPKIGPKSAAQILAQADLELLKTSILNDDPSHLSKMSGIGKKTAEKVVAGLKDKFIDMGMEVPGSEAAGPADHTFQSDAIDALISLGYPQHDARKIVQQLPPDITNANDAIKAALKELGQG